MNNVMTCLCEQLSNESVNIIIVKVSEDGAELSRWRRAFRNTASEREDLQEVLSEYPNSFVEVMTKWGDIIYQESILDVESDIFSLI